MASTTFFRLAARNTTTFARPCARPIFRAPTLATPKSIAQKSAFSSCAVRRSGGHEEETFEEFSARYALSGLTQLVRATEEQSVD